MQVWFWLVRPLIQTKWRYFLWTMWSLGSPWSEEKAGGLHRAFSWPGPEVVYMVVSEASCFLPCQFLSYPLRVPLPRRERLLFQRDCLRSPPGGALKGRKARGCPRLSLTVPLGIPSLQPPWISTTFHWLQLSHVAGNYLCWRLGTCLPRCP